MSYTQKDQRFGGVPGGFEDGTHYIPGPHDRLVNGLNATLEAFDAYFSVLRERIADTQEWSVDHRAECIEMQAKLIRRRVKLEKLRADIVAFSGDLV